MLGGLSWSKDLQVPLARLETYSGSFFPAAARLWNSIPPDIRNANTVYSFKSRYLKKYPRPAQNPLYHHGKRAIGVLHAKLRIGCSLLNNDLYSNLHVIDNPNCFCIQNIPETAEHFLLHCPWYTALRTTMLRDLQNLPNIPPISPNLLLFGDRKLDDQTNIKIFTIVHHFIQNSNRFSI